jgi:uncharacterized membrane protein
MDTGVHTAASESDFNLTVKRNCSITPGALLWILAAMMLLSFGIGIGFAWLGAWMILPFAGLEMFALAAAFYLNGRHAGDYERIRFADGRLVVEVCDAERIARHEFNPAWVRLDERSLGHGHRVLLRSHGRELEIGRHLDSRTRASLAAQLRHSLSGY